MSLVLADILRPFDDKRLARAAEAHPKTAGRWRRGETEPSGDAVLRMMRRDGAIRAAILDAIGRSDEASRDRAARLLEQALRELAA
jgi:hypothetical protein